MPSCSGNHAQGPEVRGNCCKDGELRDFANPGNNVTHYDGEGNVTINPAEFAYKYSTHERDFWLENIVHNANCNDTCPEGDPCGQIWQCASIISSNTRRWHQLDAKDGANWTLVYSHQWMNSIGWPNAFEGHLDCNCGVHGCGS